MDKNLEKLKELQGRLQFAILITLFLPTFFTAIFSTDKNPDHLRTTMLGWGIIIGTYIIIYAILEIITIHKIKVDSRWLYPVISYVLLSGILASLPILFIFLMDGVKNSSTLSSYYYILKASMITMASVPVATVILLEINFLVSKLGTPWLKYLFNNFKLPSKGDE